MPDELRLTEWQWVALKLRVGALEHKSDGLTYNFTLEFPSKLNSAGIAPHIICRVYYEPTEIKIDLNMADEAKEIFLGWRNIVFRMIKDALNDTPELARRISIERQLTFLVLEGYGMGSTKVFELGQETL